MIKAATGTARRSILVVDDIQANRAVARLILEEAGFDVGEALHGAMAVQMQVASPADLVLMDLQMPVLNGFGATERIRRAESVAGRARVPILAVTGVTHGGIREECLARGMDDHLPKPYEPGQLLRLVVRWTGLPVQGGNGDCTGTTSQDLDERKLLDLAAVLPERLFIELIGDFVRIGLEQADALARAAADGRVTTARTLLHDLVGTAGNAGLMLVSRRAGETLHQFRTGRNEAGLADAAALAVLSACGWRLLRDRLLDRSAMRAAG
ncbi:response regulator [Niveispirillum fermenti]|uniref:response regulator n=1 Tax=Niveispirillum fermenti TaxID=1233113 RepID=UPI003A846B04